MTEQNQDQHDNQEVKLVFEVMPQTAGTGSGESVSVPPASPKPGGVVPGGTSASLEQSVAFEPTGSPPPPTGRKGKWQSMAMAGLIIVLAGVGGYLAYRYFWQSSASSPEPSPTPPKEAAVLPQEWLQRYFQVEACEERERCGPEADPDADGLPNSDELKYTGNPLLPDTDFDGLSDGDEIKIYTVDPAVSDTDGDGVEDGVEVRAGRNPAISTTGVTIATPLEKQQWEEGIAKHGQHEPTPTFLNFVEFYTIFKPTTTPQLTMSVPADWKFDTASYTDTMKIVLSSDRKSSLTLRSGLLYAATTTEDSLGKIRNSLKALQGYQSIRSSQQTIANRLESIEEYQYRGAFAGELRHGLLYTIPRGTFLHTAAVEAPETEWKTLLPKAIIMLQSVR